MIEVKRTVLATAESVFAVLSDGWLYGSWVVGASRIRGVEARWPEVGAHLYHSVGIWPLLLDDTTEVLVSEPARRLTLQARGWPAGEATVDLRIHRRNDHCLVVMTEDATRGPGQLLPHAARQAVIGPRNRESLQRLALLAQGHARTAPRSRAPS